MTEAKWAACKNPDQLLDYHRMKKDPRRLRLLAAGCVRLLVTPNTPALAEEILDVVERYADGAATRAEFLAARKAIRTALKDKTQEPAVLAMKCLGDDAMEGMTVTVVHARRRNGAAQCGLIRCVCGNPYRPAAFDPAWLTSTVVALAQGIYDGRAFDRLPILADALQDAGCEDARVLGHCRGQEPHARGCWVVDGLLRRG
jgi:hypothetical protein